MAAIRRSRHLNLRLPYTAEHRPRLLPSLSPTTLKHPFTSDSGDTLSSTDFENLAVLGHGNGGTVYKVRHKKTSSIYALKVVNCDTDPAARRCTLAEITILRLASDCPQIVKYHGSFDKPSDEVAILMEYMDSSTLETSLKTNGTFSENRLASVARVVLNSLVYILARKIAHRDIKPANLLVNNKNEVKIADFGVNKLLCRTLEACNSYVGTCAYMSPERFDPETYGGKYNGFAADIWSLGLTLFELYVGYFPLLQSSQRPDWATLMCAICFDDPPKVPETASPEFRSFVDCCLKEGI